MEYVAFFYEAFEEEEEALRRHLPENIQAGFTWKTIQEAGAKNPPARIISTRTQSIYPLNWAKQISAILSRSTGYDHLLDYRAKTSSPCALGYLPLYCNRAVAEQAMMYWTVLMRKLPRQIIQFNTFNRDGLTGQEIKNKTLVVYGVGNIGYELIRIGLGLEMIVCGVDIEIKHSDVNYVDPLVGAGRADIIVCAMNLTDQNKNYFNTAFFKNVKPSTIFINISRGEIAPSTDILEALEKGHIAAAAMDVFEDEKTLSVAMRAGMANPDPQMSAVVKMSTMDNVILTPHNAFNTQESVMRKSEQSMQQLRHYLESGKFKWQV